MAETTRLVPAQREEASVWRFYGRHAAELWAAVMKLSNWWSNLLVVVVFALVIANRNIAAAVSNWNGFTRWWGLAWIGIVLLAALARAHYDRAIEREARFRAIEQRLTDLSEATAAITHNFTVMDASTGAHHNVVNWRTGEEERRRPTLSPEECASELRAIADGIADFLRNEMPAIHDANYAERREDADVEFVDRFGGRMLFAFREAMALGAAEERDGWQIEHARTSQAPEAMSLLRATAERLTRQG